MPAPSFYSYLTLAGTLPFIACAVLSLFGVASIPPLGSPDAVASSYGLLIASFMAGTHWGQCLSLSTSPPLNLFITSNVTALFIWFAYLTGNIAVSLACQGVAFLVLLAIDYRLRSAGIITANYLRVRATATAIVVLSLLLLVAV